VTGAPVQAGPALGPHYKWIALSNTTLGILMVTINQSILLIALPALFRGIKLNPLQSSNTSYFLWVFLGFILVTAVLVVSLGRVGDIYGRVRMYNLGFLIFTIFSILLSVTFLTGPAGALWIILMRVFQGIGGACLFANSTAILTDAFPANQRGTALGINAIAAICGSFLGLLIGGVLAPIEWRLVFLVSVPVGVFATFWASFMTTGSVPNEAGATSIPPTWRMPSPRTRSARRCFSSCCLPAMRPGSIAANIARPRHFTTARARSRNSCGSTRCRRATSSRCCRASCRSSFF